MKLLITLTLLLHASLGISQHLFGTVKDKNNNLLPGANVYFDNSSIATITDADGKFDLPVSSKLNLTLIISYLGYKKQYLKNYSLDQSLNIVLEEELNMLKEITIQEQLFTRKEKMALFRKQFFGDTKAAKKIFIENESDIYFTYDKATNTLHAFSDVPLKINNPYLGYLIFYELEKFNVEFSKRSIDAVDIKGVFFSGYSRFEEIVSDDKMLKRREKYYQGSALHFFRSLADNALEKNKFQIYKGGLLKNPVDCFAVKDMLGMKEITVMRPDIQSRDSEIFYNILYNKKERSRLTFSCLSFYVDYMGNYSNFDKISMLGEFGRKRIADMLPLNYGIK